MLSTIFGYSIIMILDFWNSFNLNDYGDVKKDYSESPRERGSDEEERYVSP